MWHTANGESDIWREREREQKTSLHFSLFSCGCLWLNMPQIQRNMGFLLLHESRWVKLFKPQVFGGQRMADLKNIADAYLYAVSEPQTKKQLRNHGRLLKSHINHHYPWGLRSSSRALWKCQGTLYSTGATEGIPFVFGSFGCCLALQCFQLLLGVARTEDSEVQLIWVLLATHPKIAIFILIAKNWWSDGSVLVGWFKDCHVFNVHPLKPM